MSPGKVDPRVNKARGRVMVPGYTHHPGNHCGSTALRNLLAFHGVEVSEEMALGLGAGACFFYVTTRASRPRASPTAGPRGSSRTSSS